MNILFAASEIIPLAKTGGLADVVGAMPLVLARHGVEVRVIIPAYQSLNLEECQAELIWQAQFMAGRQEIEARVYQGRVPDNGIDIYFADFDPGLKASELYPLDPKLEQDRFIIFGLVVSEWLKHSEWQPDIVHGHDWMAGPLLEILKHEERPYGTVLTIHNGKYQGEVPSVWATDLGLDRWPVEEDGKVNLLRLGLESAKKLVAVSRTYAEELQQDGLGFNLEDIYRSRSKDLVGIVNGLDEERFSPHHNPYVQPGYTVRMAALAKEQHKHLLQMKLGLPLKARVPMYGMVSRASSQKGFSIVIEALDSSPFLDRAQMVIVATRGTVSVEKDLEALAKRHPKNLRVLLGFDDPFSHSVFAASDFFVMPSKREPCGLTQLIAMRYGAIPIVHKTGGLADTVIDIRLGEKGRGIVFSDYAGQGLSNALGRSMGLYADKTSLHQLMRRNMRLDLSWNRPILEYLDVYDQVLGRAI